MENFYLENEKIRFSLNENGFISMEYGDKKYSRVRLLRTAPMRFPFEYVCVQDMEEKEIGIVRDISVLDEESIKAAENELEKRYFCPEITEFISIKMRPGSTYVDCKFGDTKKGFNIRDISNNMFFIGEDTVRINDADGNRYITYLNKLSKKSKKILEPYLY